ncbi:TIGR04219 family outer membrane beta-barrel protein [Thalassotalea crassostreae]|uniref:TIGR04219 family outer membrane beta-barrel protein n=1 Tax=Thalassotalea crassostreae TaxID=1763536 RepID=UPI000838C219|nr:TIGR04219 family outer membrane beta-barrel protein [Thalassotalea crassostreae]
MNKTAALISSLMLLTSTSAAADTLFGVYVGAQGWDMAASGSHGETKDFQDNQYSFEDETLGRFYIELEHPVPFIPNLKVAHSELTTSGMLIDNASISIDSEVDLTHTDFTLYYEVFDNGLFSFDFGITGKQLDGEISDDFDIDEVDEIIPLLYLSTEIGLPLTGLSLVAEGNFLSIDDNTLLDYQAGVAWKVIDNMIVDVSLMAGYRVLEVELDDVDDVYADLEFDGAYAGIEVHF